MTCAKDSNVRLMYLLAIRSILLVSNELHMHSRVAILLVNASEMHVDALYI